MARTDIKNVWRLQAQHSIAQLLVQVVHQTHLQDLLPLHPEVFYQHQLRRAAQLAYQLRLRHIQLLLGWQLGTLLGQLCIGTRCDAAGDIAKLGGVLGGSSCTA